MWLIAYFHSISIQIFRDKKTRGAVRRRAEHRACAVCVCVRGPRHWAPSTVHHMLCMMWHGMAHVKWCAHLNEVAARARMRDVHVWRYTYPVSQIPVAVRYFILSLLLRVLCV